MSILGGRGNVVFALTFGLKSFVFYSLRSRRADSFDPERLAEFSFIVRKTYLGSYLYRFEIFMYLYDIFCVCFSFHRFHWADLGTGKLLYPWKSWGNENKYRMTTGRRNYEKKWSRRICEFALESRRGLGGVRQFCESWYKSYHTSYPSLIHKFKKIIHRNPKSIRWRPSQISPPTKTQPQPALAPAYQNTFIFIKRIQCGKKRWKMIFKYKGSSMRMAHRRR